jgi:hypothetical protein
VEDTRNVPASVGTVQYPQHPVVHQKKDDHYQILQHAMGLVDLNATEDGRAVLWRYNADADLAQGIAPHKADGRIIDPGETPPSHLNEEQRTYWLQCQTRGELYAPSTTPEGDK